MTTTTLSPESPDFAHLALDGQYDALEKAWASSVENPGAAEPLYRAVEILCSHDMPTRALALAGIMIDALALKERHHDAAQLALTLIRNNAQNDELLGRLHELHESLFGEEPWYPQIKNLANLNDSNITAEALKTFDDLRRYTGSHVLYHPAGWGEGLVEEFIPASNEVVINFADGARQQVPLKTAIDSMRPLDKNDLRSMALKSPEEVARIAKEEPAVLIRKAVQNLRGKATSSQIKKALSPKAVPAKKWASFWKRAKAAAVLDPYLRIEGSTTRPIFSLRKKPLSHTEEARLAIQHADGLAQEIVVCREYLARASDSATHEAILEIAHERVEAALAAGSEISNSQLLEGLLLLEEHNKTASASAAQSLQALVMDGGTFQPKAFDELKTVESQEQAVSLLSEALGEGWADICIAALRDFPASVVQPVVDLLESEGCAGGALGTWDLIAPYPRRHPTLTYLFGRLYADGVFDSDPRQPDPIMLIRVLLHLARILAGERRGNATMARLLTRLTSLLVGRRNLLSRISEEIDKDSLATYLGITERGGQDFPQEISSAVLRMVADKYPDITAKPEKPFWELDDIFVTQEGLTRQQEAYRILVEVDIPRNSEAIGAAASLGDLSENSEWDAAMEEQRNLTSRAEEMNNSLRKAKLLEGQPIPDDMIAPGTKVSFSLLRTGEKRQLSLLGPWDTDSDGVINYRAPAGQKLLGKSLGDTIEVPGEQESEEALVEKIERIV
ncbi:MAG: GreA/GreB family elongation factor [Planctomycetota bacterium]|nr:GreA/GreB family elongation factor [Planctomycetota bacterium]